MMYICIAHTYVCTLTFISIAYMYIIIYTYNCTYSHIYIYRCLTCSNGPHTKDVPSVTNELALPHGEEHTPKDECEQEDKTDQQEEPCSPGGTHRRGSQKHFYTSANHPRDSLASILDDDEDDDDDGSQRTPYLILSPIQVRCTYNMFNIQNYRD